LETNVKLAAVATYQRGQIRELRNTNIRTVV
jgi:hypothetical protein